MRSNCRIPGALCDETRPHVHPKICRRLHADLSELARRDGLDLQDVFARILRLAARNWRENGRYFLARNGHPVLVDPDTDALVNRKTPRFTLGTEVVTVQNIVAFKVRELCRNGNSTLESVLSYLERSSSPIL